MLIEFRTDAHANFRMMETPACQLMKAAGFGFTVPGALQPDELPAAIERLLTAVDGSLGDTVDDAAHGADGWNDEWNDETEVTLGQRARPLLELLRAAARDEVPVLWRGIDT